MRRIACLLVLLLGLPLFSAAQAKIYTKKMKVADFTEKTLKVVLSGNEIVDAAFKSDVVNHWKLSPYEFCTLADFNKLKEDPNYYFMFIAGKNDGLDHLEVVKGTAGVGDALEKMLSVVSLPIRASGDRGVRYMSYMQAYLDFFQTFIADAMVNDIIGYSGLSRKAINAKAAKGAAFRLADCDMAEVIDGELKVMLGENNIYVVPEDEVTDMMLSSAAKTIVSYSIRPITAVKNKYCYTLLIGADDHKLYYCNKKYYVDDSAAGFNQKALEKIIRKISR